MKILKKFIIISLIGLEALYSQTITLKTAINKTLLNHPDIKAFMLRIQQSEQNYNAVYTSYLPQLDLLATYNPTKTYTIQNSGVFHTTQESGWSLGVTLHQKVWDFGTTSSIVQSSKVDVDIAKESLAEAKALLIFKVKSLYKLLIIQREAIKVREKDLEAKKAYLAQAKALFEQGLKTKADVNRFLSAVYAAEDALSFTKASFKKVKVSLSLYMGMKIDDSVKLQNSILKKKLKINKNLEYKVVENNNKIKIDRLNIQKNQLIYKSAKISHFGSIDLVASYYKYDALNNYNLSSVGISYSVPIYTSGKLTALEQKARIGKIIAQKEKDSDILALKEEYHSLLIDIEHYNQTIKTKKAQLSSAKSTQEELNARYKEGLATYLDILDNIAIVLNAKLEILEAYYSRSIAFDRIEYLKGKL
ncbi:TolC family protein [Hydrogenimonas thermophila]|uniref:Outer membrane protein TolC n=1 Tax=Hydrogenimonas thermophila TaxID=223786 RepID=A0A1I5U9L5_9BACT|nr:TolC family protein [Hydrogenimonas thermophila]SFP91973.1 Outer membrane protein TolC [Hydrogenimonas thermophila]